MTFTVKLELPDDLVERLRQDGADLADIKEAYALELYRQGRLSHTDLALALGLDHIETDAMLKRHRIFDGSPTMADLDADTQTIDSVIGKTR